MTGRKLALMILFGVLLAVSMGVTNEAVPLPEVDPTTASQNKPVVAPTPDGVDPSSPSVAGEIPEEVQTSTQTPATTTNTNR
jgi:hypothetical protein